MKVGRDSLFNFLKKIAYLLKDKWRLETSDRTGEGSID
jgi:hypothetical protein